MTIKIPELVAFSANKRLDIVVNGSPPEFALVDVALVTDGYMGARALWRTQTFRELYVTFADPLVIGMSAIAGLIEPVSRREAGGLMVRLAPAARSTRTARCRRSSIPTGQAVLNRVRTRLPAGGRWIRTSGSFQGGSRRTPSIS